MAVPFLLLVVRFRSIRPCNNQEEVSEQIATSRYEYSTRLLGKHVSYYCRM